MDDLYAQTNAQLNALFAERVDGWTVHHALMHSEFSRGKEWLTDALHYCTDANLVLPFLYSRHWTVEQTSRAEAPIRVRLDHASGPYGEATTFPRAAVIALLQATHD